MPFLYVLAVLVGSWIFPVEGVSLDLDHHVLDIGGETIDLDAGVSFEMMADLIGQLGSRLLLLLAAGTVGGATYAGPISIVVYFFTRRATVRFQARVRRAKVNTNRDRD